MEDTTIPMPRQPDTALRGYMVTVVGRASRAHNLSDPPDTFPYGISVDVEDRGIVLGIPVAATDAAAALAIAHDVAEDLFRVLATGYAPYVVDSLDPRDTITRTDAVYVADGPVPPADVAEGGITEAGLHLLDPDGEARRRGLIFRFRASGVVVQPLTEDAVRFGGRDRWSPRLRSGLSLFWAGQCSSDIQVRFVLTMAALEVLAERETSTLLRLRLGNAQRRDLRRSIEQVLRNREELSPADVDRLTTRLMDTHAVGAGPRLSSYLNSLIPDGPGNLSGGVTDNEVREWQQKRGTYLHAGPLTEADVTAFNRLNHLVGEALRRELDGVLDTSGA